MILVLEDTQARVDWLRLNTSCDIHHVSTVADFETAMLDDDFRPTLIILDHDLGNFGPSATPYARGIEADPDGRTGAEAVPAIPDSFSGHVIVWSWNPPAAKLMTKILQERGLKAQRIAFGDEALKPCLDTILA